MHALHVPTRLVDGQGGSWQLDTEHRTRVVYRSPAGDVRTPDEIARTYAGYRPVAPAEPRTWAPLLHALTEVADDPCRRPLLAGTLCVALDRAATLAGPHCPLTAGDPDTYAAGVVLVMAYDLGPTIARDEHRHNAGAAREITDVILDWIANPSRYVDVAGTLAYAMGVITARVAYTPAALMDSALRDSPHRGLLDAFLTAHDGRIHGAAQ